MISRRFKKRMNFSILFENWEAPGRSNDFKLMTNWNRKKSDEIDQVVEQLCAFNYTNHKNVKIVSFVCSVHRGQSFATTELFDRTEFG